MNFKSAAKFTNFILPCMVSNSTSPRYNNHLFLSPFTPMQMLVEFRTELTSKHALKRKKEEEREQRKTRRNFIYASNHFKEKQRRKKINTERVENVQHRIT